LKKLVKLNIKKKLILGFNLLKIQELMLKSIILLGRKKRKVIRKKVSYLMD
jgi:hypothetical protein